MDRSCANKFAPTTLTPRCGFWDSIKTSALIAIINRLVFDFDIVVELLPRPAGDAHNTVGSREAYLRRLNLTEHSNPFSPVAK
jgi:hypothetical protein